MKKLSGQNPAAIYRYIVNPSVRSEHLSMLPRVLADGLPDKTRTRLFGFVVAATVLISCGFRLLTSLLARKQQKAKELVSVC